MSGTPESSARSEFVLDASAAIRLLLHASAEVQTRLQNAHAVAPQLLVLEVMNALVTSERTGRISADRAARALDDLLALDIELLPATEDPRLVSALAIQTGLSAYDAAYLAVAESRDAPLVTADRRLAGLATRAELID